MPVPLASASASSAALACSSSQHTSAVPMEAPGTLDHVNIRGTFTHGVEISADATRSCPNGGCGDGQWHSGANLPRQHLDRPARGDEPDAGSQRVFLRFLHKNASSLEALWMSGPEYAQGAGKCGL